jgi:hypothetical protein
MLCLVCSFPLIEALGVKLDLSGVIHHLVYVCGWSLQLVCLVEVNSMTRVHSIFCCH